MKRIRIIIWDQSNSDRAIINIRELEYSAMYRKDGKFTSAGQEIMDDVLNACTSENKACMTTEIFDHGKN